MKNSCLVLFLMICFVNCQAQNLVPNPSFEFFTICPNNQAQISLAKPWFIPSQGTSDYFNACAPIGTWPSVPGPNGIGFSSSYAHSGNGMAGLCHSTSIYIEAFGTTYREYLAVRLANTLTANTKYYVTFFVKLVDSCIYAGHVSMFIGKDSISKTNFDTIDCVPQINIASGFITSKSHWTKITGSFISNGTEKYAYIGNFKSTIANDTFFVGPGSRFTALNNIGSKLNFAYYYVDDICISSNSQYCEVWSGIKDQSMKRVTGVYPNPSNGVMKVVNDASEPFESLELMDLQGKILTSFNGIHQSEYLLDISFIENGMYFLRINYKTCSVYEALFKY